MKTLTSKYLRVVALSVSLGLPAIAVADDSMSSESTTTTTTTTSAGTVSDFTPDSFTVRTTASTAPISYYSSKTTTYVDENGNPVSVDVVRSGVPVTVFYTHDGDRMVASKVIVRKVVTTAPVVVAPASTVIEKKTTTTTTSSNTSDQ